MMMLNPSTRTPSDAGYRVLGIDPGYGRCGIAVVGGPPGSDTLLHSTTIMTDAGRPFSERLREIAGEVRAAIESFHPALCALERLYFTSNQKTAMHVAEVRGALLLIAVDASIPVLEYGPGEVKAAVAGDGRADKRAVGRMLAHLLKLPDAKRHDDEEDAIAIALTARAHTRATYKQPLH